MKHQFTVIPKVVVHPDKIVCVKTVERPPGFARKKTVAHLLVSDKKHHGQVSEQAKRKVGRAVEYLLFMANDKYLPDTAHGKNYKFKLAFITLTLPSRQIHEDNFIKSEILNQFFVEARRYWKVKNYVWRAEKQRNGNIHFHILVDKFVPWSELRSTWNRICNKYGYVDNYREEMRRFHQGGFQVREDLLSQWEYKKQVKAYKAGKANDWSNPNSTDVHSLNHVHNVKGYLIKYITKCEKEMEVSGRMWGCSESLSKIKGAIEIVDSCLESEISKIQSYFPDKVYHGDHFTVINLSIHSLRKAGALNLFELFCNYIFTEYNFTVQMVI